MFKELARLLAEFQHKYLPMRHFAKWVVLRGHMASRENLFVQDGILAFWKKGEAKTTQGRMLHFVPLPLEVNRQKDLQKTAHQFSFVLFLDETETGNEPDKLEEEVLIPVFPSGEDPMSGVDSDLDHLMSDGTDQDGFPPGPSGPGYPPSQSSPDDSTPSGPQSTSTPEEVSSEGFPPGPPGPPAPAVEFWPAMDDDPDMEETPAPHQPPGPPGGGAGVRPPRSRERTPPPTPGHPEPLPMESENEEGKNSGGPPPDPGGERDRSRSPANL